MTNKHMKRATVCMFAFLAPSAGVLIGGAATSNTSLMYIGLFCLWAATAIIIRENYLIMKQLKKELAERVKELEHILKD